MSINLKKSNDLTEGQQILIKDLETKFINLNRSRGNDADSLFSHVVLQQQTEIQQVSAEVEAINETVFSELFEEFSRVANIFAKELSKLNIPFTIHRPDDKCLEGSIRIGEWEDTNDSFHIAFLRHAETRRIHGESFVVLHPQWSYRLYNSHTSSYDSLEGFTKDQYFLERIGRLHRKHNK
jgi:hypothetical protein